MSLFIDKHQRRKSPLALAAFGAALLYILIFALLYAVLAKPLYDHVRLGGPWATLASHSAVISLAGTAVCCLLFLLEDKRVAPCGFAGLAVALCMFYAAALMLDPEGRAFMLRLITLYGLPPVLAGNAVAWPVYLKIRRSSPAPEHRKTLREELLEAAARDNLKQERNTPPRTETPPVPEPPETPGPFGPEAGGGPGSLRSEEEEAMLLYMDGDEESDD